MTSVNLLLANKNNMPRFHVYITETLKSSITVDAATAEEAEDKVREGDYNNEDQSETEMCDDGLEIIDTELVNEE